MKALDNPRRLRVKDAPTDKVFEDQNTEEDTRLFVSPETFKSFKVASGADVYVRPSSEDADDCKHLDGQQTQKFGGFFFGKLWTSSFLCEDEISGSVLQEMNIAEVDVIPLADNEVDLARYIELCPYPSALEQSKEMRLSLPSQYRSTLLPSSFAKSQLIDAAVSKGSLVTLSNLFGDREQYVCICLVTTAKESKEVLSNKARTVIGRINLHTTVVIKQKADTKVDKLNKTDSERQLASYDESAKLLSTWLKEVLSDGGSSMSPSSFLLTGPPGSGKSSIAKLLCSALDIEPLIVSPESLFKGYKAAEADIVMETLIEQAIARAPSVIVIENVHVLFPASSGSDDDPVHTRLAFQFLVSMERLRPSNIVHRYHRVAIIGTSSHPSLVHPAIRSVFEEEILIQIPTPMRRRLIFQNHFGHYALSSELSANLDGIADSAHGFIGLDVWALARDSMTIALANASEDEVVIETDDVLEAMENRKPSPLTGPSALVVSVPRTRWEDIGGLEDVKQNLREMVVWPLERPQVFERMGIQPPRGILLYGPPGTGKTLLAKAVATESNCNFLSVAAPDLVKGAIGESEKAVAEVFSLARRCSPCVIFIDEFQALFSSRDGGGKVQQALTSQLLVEMNDLLAENSARGQQALQQGVTVLAATNVPEAVDPAMLRPGRFDRLVFVSLPDAAARRSILKTTGAASKWSPDVDIEYLVERTPTFSGADLSNLCRQAGLFAIEDNIDADSISMACFHRALECVKASTASATLEEYKRWQK